MDMDRYNALYRRFQKQVSIPNCPDKLDDKELEELIILMRADSATSGQRAAQKKGRTSAKAKTTPLDLSKVNMDAILGKLEGILKPKEPTI